MEAVRCDLADDVGDVVRSARGMLDWRGCVRRHPWACLGAVAALGYLVVPRKAQVVSPDVDTLLELAKRNKLVVKPDREAQKGGGLLGTLLGMGAKAAVRGATAYLSQHQRGGARGANAGEDGGGR